MKRATAALILVLTLTSVTWGAPAPLVWWLVSVPNARPSDPEIVLAGPFDTEQECLAAWYKQFGSTKVVYMRDGYERLSCERRLATYHAPVLPRWYAVARRYGILEIYTFSFRDYNECAFWINSVNGWRWRYVLAQREGVHPLVIDIRCEQPP